MYIRSKSDEDELPTMPKIVTYHWSYHHHFSPLICQSVFPPERRVTPPPIMQHRMFPHEDKPDAESQDADLVSSRDPTPQVKTLILKPRGEVSRINRGGYNLQDKLGWPATDYKEIRVTPLTPPDFLCWLISPRRLSIRLSENILWYPNHGVGNLKTNLELSSAK